jgi:tRNA A-37 threonylcarbamoyl transferase component Bud32
VNICERCQGSFPPETRFCPNDGTPLGGAPGEGEVIEGRYRLLAPIAQGGMASVFRAEHVRLGRQVAVKLISRDLLAHAEAVQRFQREAQTVARLRHPNVVEVSDFGRSADGQHYLVMELIEGEDLRQVIEREGPLPLPRVREILRQIVLALDYAHAEGVIHRDLKSANIMLVRVPDSGERVKLLDFGISKGPESSAGGLTAVGTVLGTPEYISPEQISGKPVDPRTDLYSLGVILYEMLTGALPFRGNTAEVLSAHLLSPPAPPRERRPEIPVAVEAVVLRALAKTPEERFSAARALGEAFEIACGEPAPANQPEARGATLLLGGAPAAPSAAVPAPAPSRVRAWWNRLSPDLRIALVVGSGTLALSLVLALALWRSDPAGPAVSAGAPIFDGVPAPALPAASAALPRPAPSEPPPSALVDPRAACQRALELAAAGQGERVVTAAERCVDLDPKRREDVAIARAVVQALASSAHRRASRLLQKEMPLAAKPPLLEAARHPQKAVRARAFKLAKKLGYHDAFDRVAMLLLDLDQAKACDARQKLVLALCKAGDQRALLRLEREISRPKREISCFGGKVFAAVRKLRQQVAGPKGPAAVSR